MPLVAEWTIPLLPAPIALPRSYNGIALASSEALRPRSVGEGTCCPHARARALALVSGGDARGESAPSSVASRRRCMHERTPPNCSGEPKRRASAAVTPTEVGCVLMGRYKLALARHGGVPPPLVSLQWPMSPAYLKGKAGKGRRPAAKRSAVRWAARRGMKN